MTTIFVVEDARELNQVIERELHGAGFGVVVAEDGQTAVEQFDAVKPDLVVLDWMLPRLDGLEVLRRLRRSSTVPVLMLTARSEEIDRVLGLELGADDYLTKPFSMRELLARIRALLRREELLRRTLESDRQEDRAVVRWGPLVLDPERRLATLHGQELDLTPHEFALLSLLLRNPGRAFSRSYLLEAIWTEEYVGSRAVDNAVLRLRKKLGPVGEAVETVWGVGYRLRAADASAPGRP